MWSMSPTTHNTNDIARLEAGSGLLFAGWLHDGRALIPVLLKPERSRDERRRRVLVLNGLRVRGIAGNHNSDYRRRG